MSEPFWTPLNAQPVDYEGEYDPATQYAPGDVVRYQGVDYLAVNPSLGTTPPLAASVAVPLVTALPASPADEQEVILTDSLAAGTYHWRLRYVAARATNKWVYVGGSGKRSDAPGDDAQTTINTPVATPNRAKWTVPVTGLYRVGFTACGAGAAGTVYCGVGVNASTGIPLFGEAVASNAEVTIAGEDVVTAAAGASIDLMHYITNSSFTWRSAGYGRARFIVVTPIAVGG